MGNVYRNIDAIEAGDYTPSPIYSTGIHALDRALRGGIPVNKIALFAARTSHGKTATAMRLAYNFAMQDRMVTVLWCEDDEEEFSLRSIALLAKAPLVDVMEAYRAKKMARITKSIPGKDRDLWYTNVTVHTANRPTVKTVCEIIGNMVEGSTLIIDHLGEIDWGQGVKHEAIGDGFRKIRAVANEKKVLVICMAQLNRDWDRRKAASQNPEGVRPVLSDIENSGQLEQAARVCAVLEKVQDTNGELAYCFHVFKPDIRDAMCRWDEATCTPDNPVPVPVGEAVQPDLALVK